MHSLPHAFLFSEGLHLVLSVVLCLRTIDLHSVSSSVVVSGCSLSWSELKVHIDVKKLSPVHLVCFERCGGGIGLPRWHSGKESTHNAGDTRDAGCDPWVGKMPWNRTWQPTPVFLPGKFQWAERPGRLQSMGLQRVRHGWVTEHARAEGRF